MGKMLAVGILSSKCPSSTWLCSRTAGISSCMTHGGPIRPGGGWQAGLWPSGSVAANSIWLAHLAGEQHALALHCAEHLRLVVAQWLFQRIVWKLSPLC